MHRKTKRPPVVTAAASRDAHSTAERALSTSPRRRCEAHAATDDQSFRRRVERLHALGPRALTEILAELVARWGLPFATDLDERLERYGHLRPETVSALGADRWPAPPLHLVRP